MGMVRFLDLRRVNERFRVAWLRVKLPHLDADNARRAEIAAVNAWK